MSTQFNKEQDHAIKTIDKSLLIVAGAGTGKTSVLVGKIIHIVKNSISPDNILALTFTNKAACEMRDRVSMDSPPFIGTFHSFCVLILRRYYKEAGSSEHFTIFDRDDCIKILKRCIKEYGGSDLKPRAVLSTIGKIKTDIEIDDDDLSDFARKIMPMYISELKNEKAFDFDDLIIETIKLFERSDSVLNAIQAKYTHILVDEFQDTDKLQNKLILLLKGPDTKVFAVGDADQTIYSWRGASIHNMLSFNKVYTPSATVMLTQNYRSTGNILEAANSVISKNDLRQDKSLVTSKGNGDLINVFCADDEDDEANMIAQSIQRVHSLGVKYSDIAILFRANFQARALESGMISNGIPYTVLGTRFFDRIEVKNLLAHLILVQNPDSREAFTRCASVQGGIGAKTLEKIFNNTALTGNTLLKVEKLRNDISKITKIAQKYSVSHVLTEMVSILDYKKYLEKNFDNADERMYEVLELISFSNRFSDVSGTEGIDRLLSDVSLSSDQDTLISNTNNSVRLMTVHASKGLEFSSVFISGMEEGLFPFSRDSIISDNEEERRLFYVAITRAMKTLSVSFAKRRGIFGSYSDSNPSSFLEDLPDHVTSLSLDDVESNSIEW